MAKEAFVRKGNYTFSFSDDDVINEEDFIPFGEFNPNNIHGWLLHDHGFTLAVVFASCLQDALDIAADTEKLDQFKLSFDEYDIANIEPSYLGNKSEPFDVENVDYVELENPKFSFIALFNAMED